MVMRAIWMLIAISLPLAAQVAGIDTLGLQYVRDDGDTVIITRSPGQWRVGPMISGTYHMHFGKLIIPANLVCPTDGYLVLNSGGFWRRWHWHRWAVRLSSLQLALGSFVHGEHLRCSADNIGNASSWFACQSIVRVG